MYAILNSGSTYSFPHLIEVLAAKVHSCATLQKAALTKITSPPLGNLHPVTH